jgi:hypothetical protein
MATKSAFYVIDETGRSYPNLVGVFQREFPIVTGHVLADGADRRVTYYGEWFRITLDA